MVFSSNIFIFAFLPMVLSGYFLLKKEYRNYFLLLVSLFFYFWGEPRHLTIIIVSILINYCSGIFIWIAKSNMGKRVSLFLGVVLNLSLLFYFKYFNFFIDTLNQAFKFNISVANIALPIGISFFTFQGLSYIVDLYWGNVRVQKNPLKIALYISLFPQLIAGPIVRYVDVDAQIDEREINSDKFAEGICRFVFGLAKKIILANGVGIVADDIFNAPFSEHAILTVWLGILCYTLQIYFDFSGYSDMAIGLGKMFGFDFMENFDLPYTSKSITEFWRRWHISLSHFFRDYVYIPLGGSRKGNVYFNLFVVFCLTGLWHGASWTFVVWGLWHGFFRIIERLYDKQNIFKIKVPDIVNHVITMLIVIVGWVFFRSDNLTYAIGYIERMFGLNRAGSIYYGTGFYLDSYKCFIIIISLFAALGGGKWIQEKIVQKNSYVIIRNVCTILLFFICIVYVMNATYNPFIYFRF